MATPSRTRKSGKTLVREVFEEHVRLPGAPQIIVTRAFVYDWAIRMGFEAQGGFASADYLAFGISTRPTVDEPLTDLTDPRWARLLADVSNYVGGGEPSAQPSV